MPPQCPLNFLARAHHAMISPAIHWRDPVSPSPHSHPHPNPQPQPQSPIRIPSRRRPLSVRSFFNSTDCTAASGIRHFLKPLRTHIVSRQPLAIQVAGYLVLGHLAIDNLQLLKPLLLLLLLLLLLRRRLRNLKRLRNDNL